MDLFLPAEERREILRTYGLDYGLNVFIETGTNEGHTPLALKNTFKHLYTIELDDVLWARAVKMFTNTSKVTCLHGDSATVLTDVLLTIDEPALVWLDGHYSGPGTGHGASSSTPIREELAILFDDGRKHVILVDDARIFDGEPEHNMYDHYADYPTLQWIEDLAASHDYNYLLKDDIVRLTPKT